MSDRFFFEIKTSALENNGVVIGSDKELCDYVANAPEISRRHARISVSGAGFLIEDLNSEFAIVVNGRQLKPFCPTQIGPQTIVKIAGTEIKFKIIPDKDPLDLSSTTAGAPLRHSQKSKLGVLAMVILFGVLSIGAVAGMGFGYQYYQAWKTEEGIWLRALNSNQISDFRSYISAYPEGRYRADAIRAIERVQLEKKKAELAADDATFELSKEVNTIFAFKTYIRLYPKGIHIEQAKSELARLQIEKTREEKAAAERAAWATASEANTRTSYQKYLKDFPSGPNSDNAKTAIKSIIEAEAERKSRLAKAEAKRQKLLQIKSAFENARKEDTVAAYRMFLRQYPGSDEEAACRNFIGFLYANGKSVAKDAGEGIRWFEEAAELGHTEAMMNLAYHYRYGLGVQKNTSTAAQWYKKADAAKHPYAKLHLNDLKKEMGTP